MIKPQGIENIIFIILLGFTQVNLLGQELDSKLDTLDGVRLYEKAQTLSDNAHYDSAIHYYLASGEVFKKLNLKKNVLDSKNNAGLLHIAMDRLEIGRAYLDSVIEEGQEDFPKYINQLALAYTYLGNYYSRLANYDSTLASYKKALALQKESTDTDPFDIIMTYNNIGSALNERGDFTNAVVYLDTSLNIVEEKMEPNSILGGIVCNNLGFSYSSIGDFERAEIFYLKATKIEEERLGRDHPNVALAYSNLARCIQEKGESELAISYFETSLATFKKYLGEDHPRVAATLSNIGLSYRLLEDYKKAEYYLRAAIKLKLKNYPATHPSLGITYGHLGLLFRNQGVQDSAIFYYQKNIDILKSMYKKGYPNLSRVYRFQGLAFQDNNQPEKALQNFIAGIESLSEFEAQDIYDLPTIEQCQIHAELFFNLYEKGLAHYENYKKDASLKELESAQKSLILAQAIADKVRANYRTVSSKEDFSSQSYKAYHSGVEVSLLLFDITGEKQHLEQAFSFSEKVKALTLIEAVKDLKAKDFAGIPQTLLEQETRYKVDLAYFEKKIYKEKGKGANADSGKISEYRDSLFSNTYKLNHLLSSLENRYPDYFQLKYSVNPPSIKRLQDRWLQPDQGILSFLKTEEIIYSFLITKENIQVEKIPLDFPLTQWIEEFRSGITDYFSLPNQSDNDFQQKNELYSKRGFGLYEKMLKPFEDKLPTQLVIIPEGVIGYLPFEALLVKKPEEIGKFKSYEYLIKKYQVSYCFSASLLPRLGKQNNYSKAKSELLSFAPEFSSSDTLFAEIGNITRSQTFDPLLYSKDEIKRIQKILGGEILEGNKATIEAFRKLAPNYQFLHIATHAAVNDENPDYSFLAFNNNESATEMLYLKDLYALKLDAEMVVLSACETGVGKLMKGEGMASLARGFSFSGAKSLITTLWSVNDLKTADLMELFYTNLQKGMQKDEALRQAKLDYLDVNDDYLSHPFFWASFIAIGDMTPLSTGENFGDYLLLGLLILMMGLLFFRFIKSLIFSSKKGS